LVRTGTTSKRFATNPRPNPPIERTSTSGLRPLAGRRSCKTLSGIQLKITRRRTRRSANCTTVAAMTFPAVSALRAVAHDDWPRLRDFETHGTTQAAAGSPPLQRGWSWLASCWLLRRSTFGLCGANLVNTFRKFVCASIQFPTRSGKSGVRPHNHQGGCP